MWRFTPTPLEPLVTLMTPPIMTSPTEATGPRLVLVDPVDATREALAARLAALGYVVDVAVDGASGADLALAMPPRAVIADLWMPGVSGIQLCRLLGSEPATADVPVILRGAEDDRRNRFWAERAGAVAYVSKGRMGELVRELGKALERSKSGGDFFMQFSETMDIRDRISRHLDTALFESVIAAEVRALVSCDSVNRVFDLLSQFLSQVHRYRWLALQTEGARVAIHHHPAAGAAEEEAFNAFGIGRAEVTHVQDEDAVDQPADEEPMVAEVRSGGRVLGLIALSPLAGSRDEASRLLRLVATEIGGPLRTAMLVEEIRRLASTDMLTGLMNRRAFGDVALRELARSDRYGSTLSFAILDVDHFKRINDRYGHLTGDRVLAAVGLTLRQQARTTDAVCRWGGEEFVVALTGSGAVGATTAAERLRTAIETLVVLDDDGQPIPITASFGVAERFPRESMQPVVDRADRALYEAKKGGRNRVVVADPPPPKTPPPPSAPTVSDDGGLHGTHRPMAEA